MNTRSRAGTSTHGGQMVDISTGEIIFTSTPGETPANKGFSPDRGAEDGKSNVHPDPAKGGDVIPEFVDAKKCADLLGIKRRSVIRNCGDGKYPGARKVLVDGVEVWQIPVESLPKLALTVGRSEN